MKIKTDKSVGFLASAALHAVLFTMGGVVFASPLEYAVEAGTGGVEIHLVAAQTEFVPQAAPVVDLPKEQPALAVEEDAALMQQEIEEQPMTPESTGGGSDAVTLHSEGGAITEAKPNYLKNPAPAYPIEARQNGWEGLVVLKVQVSPAGVPVKIEKESGTGHEVLDNSALKTVKSWRFRPAKIGTLPVESSVRVPIRFELDQFKK